MNFNDFIIEFTIRFQKAWNTENMTDLSELVDDDIELAMPKITFSNRFIQPQGIKGRKSFISFVKKLTRNLPMKYHIVEREIGEGKVFKIKIHYYEIDVWCWFECTLSEYGQYRKLQLLHYEDTHSKKITHMRVARNIIRFKIQQLVKSTSVHTNLDSSKES